MCSRLKGQHLHALVAAMLLLVVASTLCERSQLQQRREVEIALQAAVSPLALSPSSAPTSSPTEDLLPPEVLHQLQHPESLVLPPVGMYNVTLVTCFFDLAKQGLDTKHPAEFYLEQGHEGVLALAQPMVIFTDSPIETAKARQPYMHLTLIVNITLPELTVYKQFYSQIVDLYPRDLQNKAIFSPLLYTVWYAKPEFVKRAIELDYFHTNKFLYMDVGLIRSGEGIVPADYMHKPFPAPDREWLIGRGERVQLQSVGGVPSMCEKSVRWVEGEHPLDVKDVPPENRVPDAIVVKAKPHDWWMAGGTIGGTKRSLLEFHDVYMHELGRYLGANFANYTMDDQYLLGALACKYDLIEAIRPPNACCVWRPHRAWMFVLMFYTSATYPQTLYTAEEMANRKASEERRAADKAAEKAAKDAAKDAAKHAAKAKAALRAKFNQLMMIQM